MIYAHLNPVKHPLKGVVKSQYKPSIRRPSSLLHTSIHPANVHLQKILSKPSSNDERSHDQCGLRRNGGSTALRCLGGS